MGCEQSKADKAENGAGTQAVKTRDENHEPDQSRQEAQGITGESATDISHYETVEWVSLMPEDDLQALLNPPDYLVQITDGSMEDQIASQIQNAMSQEQTGKDSYQQALVSTDIIEAMDGKNIRIPGFVVPLEYDENQLITSFFLVPFFGACIHAPPPPPNQIIYVESAAGIVHHSLYDPVWVLGTLSTTLVENDMAIAAYSMEMQHIENYDEEE
ncbi:DUF3299 domain-containing protein [Thalassomonas viridans]|uniref:DUF3299 domain-containing protein n=2 Tax=Thalassomonas viridans TaxID=137584 RepID=A0AAF0CCZ8_9GAMM|nr:DUF3299 domain-containing protein [Thalassomonas viridans]